MTPERARQLLGGLAAGILTPEERQTLLEAALHDQALFNEVADELEIAAFLQSPETRAQLANRIEVEPERRPWWPLRARWLALSGALAASIVLFVAVRHRPGEVARPTAALTSPAASASPLATETAKMAPAKKPPDGEPSPKRPVAAKATRPAIEELSKAPTANSLPETREQQAEEQAKPAPAERAAVPMPPQPAPPAGTTASVRAALSLLPPSPAAEQPANAPRATASLTGTVRDASGAPVAGARVDIVNMLTNAATHMATDSSGRFAAPSLPPSGPYTVIASAQGFQQEQRSVTLDSDRPMQLDIPLQVGAMPQAFEVAAAHSALPLNQNLTQIAVLDFANGNEQSQSGAQVADLLSSQLLNGGQLRVIDREKVQQAVQSQNVTGHPPSSQEAAAIGRSIGADAVIVGSVQRSGGPDGSGSLGGGGFAQRRTLPGVLVTAEVIDTTQGQPMLKTSANGASLQGAANSLGNQLQSKLTKPAEGRVTHLAGDIVFVAFAESPGLRIGARCEVIRGVRKIGEVVILSVNGQSAFGKFSGAGQPRAGDRVTAAR